MMEFCSSIWTSIKHVLLFGVNLQHLKRKIKTNMFFQENSEFPCIYFRNGKSPSQNYFLRKIFISQSTDFSNSLLHLFRLLECKRMTKTCFAGVVLEQANRQFPNDSVRRVAPSGVTTVWILISLSYIVVRKLQFM